MVTRMVPLLSSPPALPRSWLGALAWCAAACLVPDTAWCAGAAEAGEPEADAAHTYTVGVLDDNPPFSFRDADGRIRGYAVDLLAAIERTRQIRFERRVGPTDEIHALFEQGDLDMLQSFVPN